MRKRITIEVTTRKGFRRIVAVEINYKRKAGIVNRLIQKYGVLPVRHV